MTNTTIPNKTTPTTTTTTLQFLGINLQDSHTVAKKETEHSMAFKQMLPHFKHVRVCKSSKPLLLKPLVVSQHFFFLSDCVFIK